jgi:hypothetical protein
VSIRSGRMIDLGAGPQVLVGVDRVSASLLLANPAGGSRLFPLGELDSLRLTHLVSGKEKLLNTGVGAIVGALASVALLAALGDRGLCDGSPPACVTVGGLGLLVGGGAGFARAWIMERDEVYTLRKGHWRLVRPERAPGDIGY